MSEKKEPKAEPSAEDPKLQEMEQQIKDLQAQLALKDAKSQELELKLKADLENAQKSNDALIKELNSATSPKAAPAVLGVSIDAKIPLKEYEVIPTGTNAADDGLKRERVLAHDPSDAKRVYFAKRNIEQTSRYSLQVHKVQPS